MTYTDCLPAAKCQLNCKCSADAGREGCLLPEGAARCLPFAPCSAAVAFISPRSSRKSLLPSLSGPRGRPGEQSRRGGSGPLEGLCPQGRKVDSLEIPTRPWHMSPGATLSRSLSSLLGSGFLPGPEGEGGRGRVSGWVEGTRSGNHYHSPGPGAVSSHLWHGLTGQTTL